MSLQHFVLTLAEHDSTLVDKTDIIRHPFQISSDMGGEQHAFMQSLCNKKGFLQWRQVLNVINFPKLIKRFYLLCCTI